ncbi:MAG: monovalent cation/H(+) antiporter subunit G [Candidatus Nezhaarchaeota archaeon]|nr:monovalent cation/H(+) antiporter subunit G [Candidatus Nezhaarchaeota archaeon]MCX8142319.1 monovalent cation/H(+) antiporter subunit G [Candidatus Nezhaarchaeota archaeon]MDW8050708.1 monovalent cation/H(+) antiporter subunit G [Nitrososphaerota archaeon]
MWGIIEQVLLYIGIILIFVGALCDLIGALGLLRFPNFFVRLHAATVGIIGGAAYPLFGLTLMTFACDFLGYWRWLLASGSFITALIIIITAPAGSHALARGAYRSGLPVEPKVCDFLEEDKGRGD